MTDKLPAQLQKQVDEANAILAEHYGPAAVEGASAASAGAAAASTEKPAGTPPAAAASSQEDPNSNTYEQRWRTAQGLLNAARREAEANAQRAANLESTLATLSTTAPTLPVATAAAKHVSPKDVEEYGQEHIEFARRVAREEVSAAVAPLIDTINGLSAQLGKLGNVGTVVSNLARKQQTDSEATFWSDLYLAVPDLEAINGDPEFKKWCLGTANPETGINRQVALNDAQKSLDVQRISAIFNAWKLHAGAAKSSSKVHQLPTKTAAELELERQVAPGASREVTVDPGSQQAKKIWTGAEITKFYRDVQRGAYRGRDDEKRALEADLFLAQAEGRVSQAA